MKNLNSLLADECSVQTRLAATMVQRGHVSERAAWTRLLGGRTNSAWLVVDAASSYVVKLYVEDSKNPLFPNNFKEEARVLDYLSTAQLAPTLVVSDVTSMGAVLVYQHLEGPLWDANVTAVAKLLYRVHQVPAPVGVSHRPDGSHALSKQVTNILRACKSKHAKTLRSLKPSGEIPASHLTSLLHGDPVPGNIVVTPQGLRLIDWQCPAQGDPCEDLALFLSPAMQLAYRGVELSKAEKATFLKAYPDPQIARRYQQLEAWYHWRMAAYCVWRYEQGHAQDLEYSLIESDYLVAV